MVIDRILLDTSAYIALQRSKIEALQIIRNTRFIYINTVILGEIKGGLRVGSKIDFNLRILQNFLAAPRIKCLPIDEETAEYYSQIYTELRRKGKPIPTNDMWIAATALQHRLPLFTYDRDFVHIENLQQGKCLDDFTAFSP